MVTSYEASEPKTRQQIEVELDANGAWLRRYGRQPRRRAEAVEVSKKQQALLAQLRGLPQ